MNYDNNLWYNGYISTPIMCLSGIYIPMTTTMSFAMTETHTTILQHALGFRKNKRSFYRNYYCVNEDSPQYLLVKDLENEGYLQRIEVERNSYLFQYKVTQKGMDYVKTFWPIRKKKEDIIRIGDKVKIINPRIIDRVGYPTSVEDIIRNEFTKEDADKVDELITQLSGLHPINPCNIFSPYTKSYALKREHLFDYIIRECAYIRLKRRDFGGNARTIHYKEIADDIKNLEFVVVDKKLAKTGNRVEGYYDSYDGESEGPSFKEEATHIILTVEWQDQKFIYGDGKDPFMYMNNTITDEKHKKFKIEACDVEKVK